MVKSHMKANSYDPTDPVPIIDFLATFKVMRDANKIHEGVAMRILPHFVKGTVLYALSSHMCAEDLTALLTADVFFSNV